MGGEKKKAMERILYREEKYQKCFYDTIPFQSLQIFSPNNISIAKIFHLENKKKKYQRRNF